MPAIFRLSLIAIWGLCPWAAVWAGDWPQWRYEAGRGAATPDALPADLELLWTRLLPPPRPAWPESQPALRFDASYAPVAAGGRLLVPSMVADSLTAFDTRTGQELWRFYADGPVRFAPIASAGRVYCASDDGHLYCLDASDGRLLWRVRGGPSDRKILGNERLISTWPIRGGPVLLNGTIYFTAGIWPFMGIFVHAVDAETGQAIWTNSGEGATWTIQPHNSPAFSGLVPCGPLAATPHGLVAPGGRTEPGCYDLKTGKLLHFSFGPKQAGTWQVSAHGQWFFVGGTMRRIGDGTILLPAAAAVHDDQAVYEVKQNEITACALDLEEDRMERTGRKGEKTVQTVLRLKPLWRRALPETPGRLFLKAGPRFYCGSAGRVTAIEADANTEAARIAWRGAIEGEPWAMLAADDRLFVVTTAGRIYCFGTAPDARGADQAQRGPSRSAPEAGGSDAQGGCAKAKRAPDDAIELLNAAGVTEGYCVLFGLGAEELVEHLARSTLTHVLVIDPDPARIGALRRRLDDAGLYGTRVAALVGDAATVPLPPYLASLVIVQGSEGPGLGKVEVTESLVKRVFSILRPYGGTACLPVAHEKLQRLVEKLQLPGLQAKPSGKDAALLVRAGGLPGAADWTHQYADAANSVTSQDTLVKAPLGLLWFGGPANDEVLPRHGHGPSPQVAAGRLVLEGRNMLRALDVYTGRLLWQKNLPDLGAFYDNTKHQPGANEIGSNFVTLADAVYVAYRETILQIDPATGGLVRQFRRDEVAGIEESSSMTPGVVEVRLDSKAPARWGFLAAWEDLLIATWAPVAPRREAVTLRQLLLPSGEGRGAEDAKDAPAGPPQAGEDRPDKNGPQPNPSPDREGTKSPPRVEEALIPADYASASRWLVVFDRHNGKVLWQREAKYSFRHNTIAAGSGKLFVIDALSTTALAWLKRRGAALSDYQPRLVALDVRTGQPLWSTTEHVFGTMLNYSSEYDVLLQAGSAARDRADDEANAGMVAYHGSDGRVLWKDLRRAHSGPCMLHHDTIITQQAAYCLLTGEPRLRRHPLTDEPIPWQFTRNYGCNTAIASEHLLTFRSAAAGFFDLERDGGTGNLGGFKSGCTSNLIAACGVLNAPEYTRTCLCNYQNQTSLALVHDPAAEMWTFNALRWDGRPVRRVGINFGAPGDRRSDAGTLWLDYPSRGGPSPDLPVELDPPQVDYFRHHSSQIRVPAGSAGLSWVAASGVQGVRRATITLAKEPTPPRRYTVRLHFAEIDDRQPAARVFSVRLQGKTVLAGLDILKESGAPMTALVKEVRGIEVSDKLRIDLDPENGTTAVRPILCGVEILAEGW